MKIIISLLTLNISLLTISAFCEIPYEIPQKAVNLINQGNFDKADEELKSFRRKNPDNPLGIFYLACIEKDADKATALFREVETISEPSLASEALYRRAEIQYSQGKFDLAAGLYKELIAKYPMSDFKADSYMKLGNIELSERPKNAIPFFSKCLEFDKNGSRRLYALTGIMESYVKLENWNRAMETAIAVLKEKDDLSAITPRVLEVLSLSWEKIGNQSNSDRFAERLVENYPGSYQAHSIRSEGNSVSGNNPVKEETEKSSVSIFEDRDAEFTVQAAAFKERNNALRLMRSLKNAGFDARIDMKSVSGTNLFVVRVGYYKSSEDAQKEAERISKVVSAKASVMLISQ